MTEYINDQLDQLPLKPRQNPSKSDEEPVAKRRKLDKISEFDDDFDDSDDDCEPTAYTNMKVAPSNCQNVLKWWAENSEIFPNLAVIARNALSVMSTSAASERNFRLAGHLVSERRTNLNSTTVNDVLFINSAIRNVSK